MSHWDVYDSYNTVQDAQGLLDIAQSLREIQERAETGCMDDDDIESLHWIAESLTGTGQRLSRLDTRYPYPDPIPEHWGPKPPPKE